MKDCKRFFDEVTPKLYIATSKEYIGCQCNEEGYLVFKAFDKPVEDWLCRKIDSSGRMLVPRICVENFGLRGYVDAVSDAKEETVTILKKGTVFAVPHHLTAEVPDFNFEFQTCCKAGDVKKDMTAYFGRKKHRSSDHCFKYSLCNTKDRYFCKIEVATEDEIDLLPTYEDLLRLYGNGLNHFRGYAEFIGKLFVPGKLANSNVAVYTCENGFLISTEVIECDFNEEHEIHEAIQKGEDIVLCPECAAEKNEVVSAVTEVEKLLLLSDKLLARIKELEAENSRLEALLAIA